MDTLQLPPDTIFQVKQTVINTLVDSQNAKMPYLPLLIIPIILVSGSIGGTINFLSISREVPVSENNIAGKTVNFHRDREFYLQILLGICGAGLIPLFLYLTDSKLFTRDDGSFHSYFVFFGYCVLGAVFSRAILNSLSSKIFNLENKLKNVEKKVDQVEQEQNKDNVEPDKSIEVELATAITETSLFNQAVSVLDNMQNSKYRDRSISGLSKGTKLDPETIKKIMSLLEERSIVLPIVWYGSTRYRLTEEGKTAKLVQKP